MFALLLCSLLVSTSQAGGRATAGWEAAHPVQLGGNVGFWQSDYAAPGIGGDLSVRPVAALGVDLFWNSFANVEDVWLWHDHVIGFSLFAPSLLGSERFFLSPTFGSCVDFRFQSPLTDNAPKASDLAFGTHAGGMLEVRLGGPVSLEAEAMATIYWDNGVTAEAWRLSPSEGLLARGVVQSTLGLSVEL